MIATAFVGAQGNPAGESRRPTDKPLPAAGVRIPLVPYFRDLRTVTVSTGGREHSFLFDTGGGRTLITPALAARIGCRPSGRDVGYRMTGEPVVFQNCDRLGATAGGFPIGLSPVAVFDLAGLLPKELPALDGVLALDAFRGHVVTIDWTAGLVTVASSKESDRSARDRGVPLRFATGENGSSLTALVQVPATRGPYLWFLLDSGNIRGTLVAPHVREQGLLPFPSEATTTIRIGDGPPKTYDVSVADINYDGVLGTAFLRSAGVTIDLRRAPGASGRE
jgi:hypothetical protein